MLLLVPHGDQTTHRLAVLRRPIISLQHLDPKSLAKALIPELHLESIMPSIHNLSRLPDGRIGFYQQFLPCEREDKGAPLCVIRHRTSETWRSTESVTLTPAAVELLAVHPPSASQATDRCTNV